jgi:hypothetical protein
MRDKFVILIIFVLLTACIRIDTGHKQAKEECYSGKIIKIYQNDKDHYMYYFDIKTRYQIIAKNAGMWSQLWTYAQVGDSIIKPSDTLMIIIKKNDSTKREFFYKF